MKFTEGQYKGQTVDEPDYESLASCSTLIGVSDLDETLMLADQIDQLGIDCNETGWVIAWPKCGRTRVPFLAHGFKSPFRWVPFRAEMFVSRYWNRVCCWLYGGHDTILYDMRIDADEDGSYHCPMCCAVVGWRASATTGNRYFTLDGTAGVGVVTSRGTALRERSITK